MEKKLAKDIAKDALAEAIGTAYYKISDNDKYTDDEQEQIIKYLDKYGKASCKAIGKDYVAY